MSIQSNLKEVETRIREACGRCGRDPGSVTLIAVSKTKPASDIREAMAQGCDVFGENKVQELREKAAEIAEPLHWHMIGHLQANKVKYLPGLVELIHSVDNRKLAEEIERQAAKHGIVMDVLCEVNMAGEETKFGLSPEEAPGFLRSLAELPHLRPRGLMTIAPYTEDPETNRPYFRGLREMLERLNRELPPERALDTLSMGMTGDYEVAIEEGATMVRVGTGIFGARDYPI